MATDRLATAALDRTALIAWYRRNRERSRALFDLLTDDAYYAQPITLRHPIVFYDGHLPAFSFNTLVKRGLGALEHRRRPRAAVRARHRSATPRRSRTGPRATSGRAATTVRAFAAEADRQVLDVLAARRPRPAGPSAARSRRSRVRHPRARGDAPGDAALHVASPALRAETRPARLSTADGWPGADGGVDRGSRGPGDARRRCRRGSRSRGTTSDRRATVDVAALRHRAARRHERRVPRVRRSRRLSRPALVDGGRLALAAVR